MSRASYFGREAANGCVRRYPPANERGGLAGTVRPPYLMRTFAALAAGVCAHARGRGSSAC
jgi:hypothetical protein